MGVFGLQVGNDLGVFLAAEPGIVVDAAVAVQNVLDGFTPGDRRIANCICWGFLRCRWRGRMGVWVHACSLYYRNSAAGENCPPQGLTNKMAKETEIKLRISDVPAFRRALKRIGARLAGPGTSKVHEENVIFDTPQGGLAKHGQLLRIRKETHELRGKSKTTASKQRVVLTFKQPMAQPAGAGAENASYGSYKVREEIEVEVAEAGNLARIFEGL